MAGYTPEVDILNGVDIDLREGEIVTIVGPNGAGKSTLMKSIFGLLPPREGRVELRGEDITGDVPHNVTRRGVSYVPQLANVFPNLTVLENLEIGAVAGVEGSSRSAWKSCSSCSRGLPSAAGSRRARCRAASARWSRWRGR